jgi:hypothetical protein
VAIWCAAAAFWDPKYHVWFSRSIVNGFCGVKGCGFQPPAKQQAVKELTFRVGIKTSREDGVPQLLLVTFVRTPNCSFNGKIHHQRLSKLTKGRVRYSAQVPSRSRGELLAGKPILHFDLLPC